ncbi:MRG-domain-containing protein [Artomyces pyxidatus]|uniref:MRG-domain-containing protein n=1 Tax=Artomyces pyxidatus TaxID=48021 RepID=A0ACB8SW76_9AGAM|nr:MRG-domain-containing protein [Artomyces pyxidatus]
MSVPVGYSAGERVLCYHGPLIYEAKVLKTETWDELNTKLGSVGPHYFVHYKGWKQTWDEWVPSARLLKFNEANLALQKSLSQQQAAATSASAASAKAAAAAKGAAQGARRKEGGRGTKRAREEDDGARRPEMRLQVPEALKVLLVDDWEAVTKNNMLVTLPRSPTVVEILAEFRDHVLADPPAALRDPRTILPTIVAGLQVYFDRALGANLLYRFERPQYAEIRKRYVTGPTVQVGQEREMSAVYGAEHLLRMLVSLPTMVAGSTMDPESVGLVRDYVAELMAYMLKERHRIFQQEYDSASLQYQNISRS